MQISDFKLLSSHVKAVEGGVVGHRGGRQTRLGSWTGTIVDGDLDGHGSPQFTPVPSRPFNGLGQNITETANVGCLVAKFDGALALFIRYGCHGVKAGQKTLSLVTDGSGSKHPFAPPLVILTAVVV